MYYGCIFNSFSHLTLLAYAAYNENALTQHVDRYTSIASNPIRHEQRERAVESGHFVQSEMAEIIQRSN